MKRMACALVVIAGAAYPLGAIAPAAAEQPVITKSGSLQLSVSSPVTPPSGGPVLLKVRYSGGNIGTIALYIDGSLVSRKPLITRTGHGVIEFRIEPGLIPAGDHRITIAATDLQGNAVEVRTAVQGETPVISGPVSLVFPKRGAVIQGVIPIQVKVDPSVSQPFVTFLVDNQFLDLTNYAPFSYNWDSSHIANGPHTITVEVIDGNTQVRVQTLNIPVVVNNPGGLTMRHDFNTAGKPSKQESIASPVNHITNGIVGNVAVAQPDALAAPALVTSSLAGAASLDAPRIAAFNDPTHTIPVVADHNMGPLHFTAVPNANNTARPFHPGILGVLESNHESVTASYHSSTELAAPALLAPHRAGNFAAIPGSSTNIVAAPTSSKPVFRTSDTVVVGHSNRFTSAGGVQIAFDSTRLVFDVPPRVVNGIPLAPFRQIFEHTGGVVQWFNHSKTVRAINSNHEIVFRIGHKHATINNQRVKMQVTPYIDRGRSIVPLSFVKQALNVIVHFDPRSGHINIESKQ